MNYTLPNKVKNLLDSFQKAKFQIFIVGGAVRDLLLNKPVKDWDFTTDATPEQILKIIPDGFYDNKFGTVGLDGRVFEITTMRKEGVYKDSRHPSTISWTNKIEEDLARRDFTINAIALGKTLVDPFNGQEDLQLKLIRAVEEPDERFREDALRLIRAIRFSAQLNFEIEDKTFLAIIENKELIKNIAWERITQELFKILAGPNPNLGIVKLREAGILEIILPEVEKCFGIKQKGPKHNRTYDIGEHALLSLKLCPSSDPLVRLIALIHDIGKPATMRVQKDGNVTFYGHDVVGEKLSRKVCRRLKLSNKESEKISKLIRWHMFTVDEKQTDSAIRRFIKNIGVENIEDMLNLRVADRLGGGTQRETSWRMEEFKKRIKEVLKKPFSISDLKISGNDVMKVLNIKPGPKVGKILENLFKEVLDDSSRNNREYLLEKIKLVA